MERLASWSGPSGVPGPRPGLIELSSCLHSFHLRPHDPGGLCPGRGAQPGITPMPGLPEPGTVATASGKPELLSGMHVAMLHADNHPFNPAPHGQNERGTRYSGGASQHAGECRLSGSWTRLPLATCLIESIQVASSRYLKDVPKTLGDMADLVNTEGGGNVMTAVPQLDPSTIQAVTDAAQVAIVYVKPHPVHYKR
jgi:hypothetical protein